MQEEEQIRHEARVIVQTHAEYILFKGVLMYSLRYGQLDEFCRIKAMLLKDEYDEHRQRLIFTEYCRLQKIETWDDKDIAVLRYWCNFQIGILLPTDPALLPPLLQEGKVRFVKMTPHAVDDFFTQECFRDIARRVKGVWEAGDKADQKKIRRHNAITAGLSGGDIVITMSLKSYELVRDAIIARGVGVKETRGLQRIINLGMLEGMGG